MSEADTLYYFFHNCYDAEFVSSVNRSLGEWMYIHSIKAAAVKELLLYLILLLVIEINIFLRLEDWLKGCKSMMKKIIPVIVTVLIICLSFPSVPAFASGNNFKVVTNEILVSNFGDKASLANGFYQQQQSFFEGFNVEAFNNVSSLPFDPFADGVYYALYAVSNGNLELVAIDVSNVPGNFTSVYTNKGLTLSTDNIAEQIPSARAYNYFFNKQNSTWVLGSGLRDVSFSRDFVRYLTTSDSSLDNVPAQNNKYPVTIGHTDDLRSYVTVTPISNSSLCFTNAEHVYTLENLWNYYFAPDTVVGSQISNYWATICSSGKWVQDMNSSMIDFQMDGMTPYFDGSGVVDPAPPEESNENHMYFNSADVGFCEPSGVSSYSSFGGAYFYVKYNVDNWIKTHINDYDLYFSATGFVGDRQYNGSVRLSLDADGCICIPFSNIFTTDGGLVSNGFIAASTNKQIEQNFYKSYLYSVSSDKLPALLDKFNNVSDSSMSGAWDKLLDVTFGNWLFAYTQTGATNVISNTTLSLVQDMVQYYSNYKIQVNFYLVDNDDNRSGSIGRMFDLALGSDVSTDNEGLENQNPYVPTDEDLEDDDFLPVVPPSDQTVVTTGSGAVNVYNMTPSEIELTIQDGLDRFVSWYNTTPDTQLVQNRFWDSMGIFKGNPASELYEDYWGFLPDNFKNVILGCATIGIIGGACTILRKRLMK